MPALLTKVREITDTLLSDDARQRLGAWWRGEPRQEQALATGSDEFLELSGVVVPAPTETSIAHRIAVAEQLWGAGNLSPGDSDFTRELGVTLGLSKEKSIAFIGVGLGGAARAIVDETEVWVTGYESNASITALAIEQNTMAGKAKKVTVGHVDLEALDLPKQKFNAVVAKESFYLIKDKAKLLATVAGSLRPGGYLVFTDYVENGAKLDESQRQALFCQDWGAPFPVMPQEYRSLIEAHGLELRVDEDVSERYAAYATRGWSNLRRMLDRLGQESDDIANRNAIMRVIAEEASIWANRLDAFRDGRMAVHRFLAMKPA